MTISFKGTYNVLSIRYMDSLEITKIEDHIYKLKDPQTNEVWYDFSDEASLFSGYKYQTLEDVKSALNQYIKHLG